MASVSDFLAEWHSDLPYIVAHTSGSTGVPKEIRLPKADMLQSAGSTNAFFGITSTSVLAIPLSMNYIAGKMMAVRAFRAGCRLLELPVSNQVAVSEPVDLLSVVPSQLPSLLASPQASARVRKLLVGGAPLDDITRRAVVDAGFDAYIGYGMTETCSHVALRSLSDESAAYHAMPDISFSVDDRDCLIIKSPKFSWGELVTNDIVLLLDDKTFVWLGRYDNVINSGGIKVFPEQVEHAISALAPADFPPFYIAGRPSQKWGTEVVMVAQGAPQMTATLQDAVNKMTLPRGWRPVAVIMVDSLPRTSNGKVKRSAEFADFT